jgi:hypothetical protein
MKARIVLALAMILVLIAASSASVAAKGAVVPFKATYHTYPEMVDISQTGLTLAIPGEGQATHLGRSTWYADSWVTFGAPNNHQWGNMTFTAANGDHLLGTFDGQAYLSNGTNVFWGTFEITEGTGRFAGATGAGDYWGTAQENEGMLYFDGMLTK